MEGVLLFLQFSGQLLDSHEISVQAPRYIKPAFPIQYPFVEHVGLGVLQHALWPPDIVLLQGS